MRSMKSERLKKLEAELYDLEQWLKLGLVPKKDIEKHKEEIQGVRAKLEEERERLQFLKESGESEEYVAPKRNQQTRSGYTEMQTIPDIEGGETTVGGGGESYQMDSEFMDMDTALTEEDEDEGGSEDEFADQEDEDEESYFSDKNRWKRGSGIIDPDDDRW